VLCTLSGNEQELPLASDDGEMGEIWCGIPSKHVMMQAIGL
jgi:hypothetical protein